VDLLCDDENNLKAVYFQDGDMKNSYEAWPEFLCMDSTYKLLQLQLSVFILLCEDCSGTTLHTILSATSCFNPIPQSDGLLSCTGNYSKQTCACDVQVTVKLFALDYSMTKKLTL